MRIFEHTSETWLARPRAEVFEFFADAANLERLTPPWLGFEILTPRPIAMRVGALIDYRLRVHGVPLRWRTEITEWQPPLRFVDEPGTGGLKPYLHVRGRLEALLARPLLYELAAIGETLTVDGMEWFGVRSGGRFFAMMPAARLAELSR